MVHFYDKRAKTAQPNDSAYVRVWCGRLVRRNTAVTTLTSVACSQCRAAFAAVLARLPNVDDRAED